MYSERDMHEIDRRIRTNLMVLLPVLAALLAAYIWGLAAGVKWLVMAAGPVMFAAARANGVLSASVSPGLRRKTRLWLSGFCVLSPSMAAGMICSSCSVPISARKSRLPCAISFSASSVMIS